ncbi:MAG: hypothetical protein JSV33_13500 [bacterium]|nr:MAG: hypothetical protein JSV33_13500 [bacterium]
MKRLLILIFLCIPALSHGAEYTWNAGYAANLLDQKLGIALFMYGNTYKEVGLYLDYKKESDGVDNINAAVTVPLSTSVATTVLYLGGGVSYNGEKKVNVLGGMIMPFSKYFYIQAGLELEPEGITLGIGMPLSW